MANLQDLAELTGHKSISDMTTEELREHLRVIRQSRRETKKSDLRMSESAIAGSESKLKKTTKKKTPGKDTALEAMLGALSPEQLAAFIEKMNSEEIKYEDNSQA